MFRYAKYAVPFILKAPRRSPVKVLAGLAASYALLFIGMLFVIIAAFIWIVKHYGSDAAFLVVGATFIVGAVIILVWSKRRKPVARPLPANVSQDPLANYIPANLRESPTVQKLLIHVSENPVAATVTALTLGMLISNELIEELK